METYDNNVLTYGMNPEITSVQDAEDLHRRMVQLDIKIALSGPYAMPHYRGEQKYGWELLPNIFRLKAIQGDHAKLKDLEKKAWLQFEQMIKTNFGNDALRTIFNNEKHGKDWDSLMQAQHAGVKTSLLDWSPTVYVPLYFATEKSSNTDIENADGQFWVYMTPFEQIKSHNTFPVKDTFYSQDPQQIKMGTMINVSTFLEDLEKRKFETRWYHQKGRFFVSGEKEWSMPMNHQPQIVPHLFRFIVPAKYKESIRQELTQRQIDYDYLYGPYNPDHQKLIDGINTAVFGV